MARQRATARVLPVSPDGAVLLLEEQDPARPGELYWCSIGGGVDAGESWRDAAVRELREEAGIVVAAAALLGPVHHLRQPYSWGGVDHVGDHTHFAVPMRRDVKISFDRLEPEEVGNVLGAGWWTPGDLAGVAVRPSCLPEIATAAVVAAGGVQ